MLIEYSSWAADCFSSSRETMGLLAASLIIAFIAMPLWLGGKPHFIDLPLLFPFSTDELQKDLWEV